MTVNEQSLAEKCKAFCAKQEYYFASFVLSLIQADESAETKVDSRPEASRGCTPVS